MYRIPSNRQYHHPSINNCNATYIQKSTPLIACTLPAITRPQIDRCRSFSSISQKSTDPGPHKHSSKQKNIPKKKVLPIAPKITDKTSHSHLPLSSKDISSILRKGTLKESRRVLDTYPIDINQPFYKGQSPLEAAVRGENILVAKEILSRGANVNLINALGEIPLHNAVKTGNARLCAMLIANGANISYRFMSETPPHDLTDSLSRAKRNLVAEGATPLMIACTTFHASVVEKLLEHGAPVDQTDNYGRTALMYAAQYSSRAIIETLRRFGADVNAYDDFGHGVKDYASLHAQPNMTSIIDLCFSGTRLSKEEYREINAKQLDNEFVSLLKHSVLNDRGALNDSILRQIHAKVERLKQRNLPIPDKIDVVISKEADQSRHFSVVGKGAAPSPGRTQTEYSITTFSVRNVKATLDNPNQYVADQDSPEWYRNFTRVTRVGGSSRTVETLTLPNAKPPKSKKPVVPVTPSRITNPQITQADKNLHSSLASVVKQFQKTQSDKT